MCSRRDLTQSLSAVQLLHSAETQVITTKECTEAES